MYYRRKILLAIVAKTKAKKISKLSLQKLLFLFCQNQKNAVYDFIPYHYGCYSFTANKDLSLLADYYHLLEDNKKAWSLKREQNYIDQLSIDDAEILEYIFTTYEEENQSHLLSIIYQNYPYFAISSKRILSDSELVGIQNEKKIISSQISSTLFTIGYESKSIEQYLNQLIRNNISLLIDIRRNPLSKKYGFSKNQLKNYCDAVGIKYYHFPELGIDSALRQELTDFESYTELFETYKKNLNSKMKELNQVYDLIKKFKRAALTCFEKDHSFCHRSILANQINFQLNMPVKHL